MNAPLPSVRHADHPIDPLILERWSPRAFDASALDETHLLTLFEAARWAPSAFNAQPWRFVWALRDGEGWTDFLSALLPFNAAWAQAAAALVFILSDCSGPEDDTAGSARRSTASFDTGAAWGMMALQAARLGLSTHAMAGFDRARAVDVLGSTERWHIEAAVAVGRIGDPATLSDSLRQREFPSLRKPVEEFAFHGRLPA